MENIVQTIVFGVVAVVAIVVTGATAVYGISAIACMQIFRKMMEWKP